VGLFNVGNILGKVQEAAGTVTTAAMEATKDIKIPDVLQDFKVPDSVTDFFAGQTEQKLDAANQIKVGLTMQDALRLYFYLMAADGEIHSNELERFNAICEEYGKEFVERQGELVTECQEKLTATASSISPLVSAMSCVDSVLYAPADLVDDGANVTPKLLVWNLLALAYSDDNCDDLERELIRHVAQRVDVSEAAIMDMESYIHTINDLEREIAWVKTTNQTYLAIEASIKELEARKAAVFDGVTDLISL
jgi:uncharacterized tellurite resistance protein B-like protein